jgi:CBS-domain-containing membrane protein
MRTAELMSHPAIAIDCEAPIERAIELMDERKLSGLPVTDASGAVVGMLTEGDLLRRAEIGTQGAAPGWVAAFFRTGHVAEDFVKTHGHKVSEVMTEGVVWVEEDTPVDTVVELIRKHGVKRLPVLRGNRLVGVISRADIVRALGRAMREETRATVSADDASLGEAVRTALNEKPWSRHMPITIGVKDGVVDLDGCVYDVRVRDAIGVLAENTPGVKQVLNRIVCIEPYSGTVTFAPDL